MAAMEGSPVSKWLLLAGSLKKRWRDFQWSVLLQWEQRFPNGFTVKTQRWWLLQSYETIPSPMGWAMSELVICVEKEKLLRKYKWPERQELDLPSHNGCFCSHDFHVLSGIWSWEVTVYWTRWAMSSIIISFGVYPAEGVRRKLRLKPVLSCGDYDKTETRKSYGKGKNILTQVFITLTSL